MKIHAATYYSQIMLCILITILAFGCAKKPDPILRVGTNVWPGYECLYLARSLGYYDNTRIKLVEYSSASDVIHAYRSGSLEAAALTMDEVFLLAEHGLDPKIVLIMDYSLGGDVILGKTEIRDLVEIKGQRVGVESNALGAFVLTRALERTGMTIKDVDVIPLEVNEHENAFKKGMVDAIVTFEPVRSNLLASGANLLFDSSQIPGEILDVLVIREEILDNHNSTVDTLLKGWFLALDYLNRHPEDAAVRIAPREGISPEQFLKSLENISIPDINENLRLLGSKDTITLNGMDRLAEFMLDTDLLKQPLDAFNLIDNKPIMRIK